MAVAWSRSEHEGDDLGGVWRASWAEAQRYDGLVGWARLNEVATRYGATRIARRLPRGVPCVVQAVEGEPMIVLADWLVGTPLESTYYWHALGHVWLEHGGPQFCVRAPMPSACHAACLAGLALSVPPASASRGPLVIARQTGQPVEIVTLWAALGRRYGTLPGHVSHDEVADTLIEALRWTRAALDEAAYASIGR